MSHATSVEVESLIVYFIRLSAACVGHPLDTRRPSLSKSTTFSILRIRNYENCDVGRQHLFGEEVKSAAKLWPQDRARVNIHRPPPLYPYLNSFHQLDEEVGSKMDVRNLATVIAPNVDEVMAYDFEV